MEILLVTIGFVVGILMGLTGIGGAAYVTPILILLGVPPLVAVGSNVTFLVVAKSWGAFLHIRKKNIDYLIFKFLVLGNILSIGIAYLTLTYIATFNNEFFNKILVFFLGFLLIGIGFQYLLNILRRKKANKRCDKIQLKKLSSFLMGALISFLINFTSIGGGSILMPYLMKVMDNPRIMVGTSLLFGFITVVLASLLHIGLGNVNLQVSLLLILGSLPGIYIGTMLTTNIQRNVLLIFIAISVIIIGIIMLGQAFSLYFYPTHNNF